MDPIFDTHIYGPWNKFEGYSGSIPVDDDDNDDQQHSRSRNLVRKMSSYTAPKHLISELQLQTNDEEENNRKPHSRRIIDRENDYRKRRLNRKLSPPRHDPFAAGDRSPEPSFSTYGDVMRENTFQRLEHEAYRVIAQKRKDKNQGFKEDDDTYADKKRRSDLEERKSSEEKTGARVSNRDKRKQNFSAQKTKDY